MPDHAEWAAPSPDADRGGPALMPVEEAVERVLSAVGPLPPVEMPLRQAHGAVLAEPVAAPLDLPPFASSAMDGYAVRAEDVAGASRGRPAELTVAGEVEMGRPPGVRVAPGTAAAVPTGGPIPPGADSVVPIEDCAVEDGRVLVFRAAEPGAFVRPAGQDARAGELLVPAGRRLGAPELGLLASAGVDRARVHPKPRVMLISTGRELLQPGAPPEPGRIYDANAFTLFGAVVEAGATPVSGGTVADDPDALRRLLEASVGRADVFVTSGGVSMGEADPVRAAFAGRSEVELWRVAMQPGMPQAFGEVRGRPFFGLPGNPVSVFVSFELLVRPALLKMMGRRRLFRPEVTATLETELEGLPGKTRFARVLVRRGAEGWTAASAGGYQSNLLSTLSGANGLAIIPPGTASLAAGEPCRVMLFRHLED